MACSLSARSQYPAEPLRSFLARAECSETCTATAPGKSMEKRHLGHHERSDPPRRKASNSASRSLVLVDPESSAELGAQLVESWIQRRSMTRLGCPGCFARIDLTSICVHRRADPVAFFGFGGGVHPLAGRSS